MQECSMEYVCRQLMTTDRRTDKQTVRSLVGQDKRTIHRSERQTEGSAGRSTGLTDGQTDNGQMISMRLPGNVRDTKTARCSSVSANSLKVKAS